MEQESELCGACRDITLPALIESIPIPSYPRGGGCGIPNYFEYSIPQPLSFPNIAPTKLSCALCRLISHQRLQADLCRLLRQQNLQDDGFPSDMAEDPFMLAALCPPSSDAGYMIENERGYDAHARIRDRGPQWFGFSDGEKRVNTLEPITQKSGTRSKTESLDAKSSWQINVAADEGSPANKYITRHPLSDRGSKASFETLLRIVDRCNVDHSNCRRGVDGRLLEEPPELPVRVIDVGDAQRLPKVYQSYGHKANYTTLSHCWGEQRWVAMTTESLAQMLESFDTTTIPKTYADAIAVTRELGVRYLWIDSFCIIQDDQDDWERESQKMGDIYEKAYVNIAAAGAENGEAGLFDTRKQPIYVRMPADVPGNHFYLTDQPDSSFEKQVNQVRLNTRGWVMQERLLSRRTIHFAADMWYWECSECIISEDGWQHQPPASPNKPTSSLRKTLGGSVSAIGKVFRPNEVSEHDNQTEDLTQTQTEVLWCQILRAYSICNLTFSRDKLPALQGLVNRFKGVTSLPYMFGHWIKVHEPLPPSTMWCAATNGGLSFPDFKLAPSWSCLKGNGAMDFYDTRGTTPCTRIDRIEGDFPALMLRGRVRAGTVAFPNGDGADKPTFYSLSFQSKTEYGTFTRTLGPAEFDDATDIPKEITLLLAYEKKTRPLYLNDQKDQLALVLREISAADPNRQNIAEEGVKIFQRIGIAHINNHHFFNDIPFSKLTII